MEVIKMINKDWAITKWCKSITDDDKDLYTKKTIESKDTVDFRLLDDDKIIYAYGIMDKEYFNEGENGFMPLDYYTNDYGCTEIQFKNSITKVWETL
jgi:hypothetical protein